MTCLQMVTRDLFRLSPAVRHGMEAIVYNNYPKEVATSTCMTIICPDSSALQQCQCSSRISDVGRGSLKQPAIVFDIRSLTWDEWIYPLLLLLRALSDPRRAEPCFEQKNGSVDVWASPRHTQNALSGE